jgi:hypothetical protein
LDAVGAPEDRIARNEALFRSVNERVRDLAASQAETEAIRFVCECGRSDCAGTIELTLQEYEAVRADPAQFMVVAGHESHDVETVVARHDGYDVVRKHAAEARIAIETNPRSRGRGA